MYTNYEKWCRKLIKWAMLQTMNDTVKTQP